MFNFIYKNIAKAIIGDPRFANLMVTRIIPHVISGVEVNLKQWSTSMSNFTDAMTALVAKIKASEAAVDPAHITSLDAAVASLQTAETADAANITDIQAGLAILTNGLATDATPTPAAAAVVSGS